MYRSAPHDMGKACEKKKGSYGRKWHYKLQFHRMTEIKTWWLDDRASQRILFFEVQKEQTEVSGNSNTHQLKFESTKIHSFTSGSYTTSSKTRKVHNGTP